MNCNIIQLLRRRSLQCFKFYVQGWEEEEEINLQFYCAYKLRLFVTTPLGISISEGMKIMYVLVRNTEVQSNTKLSFLIALHMSVNNSTVTLMLSHL